MKLSIVIPAHNEEHRLPPVLRRYAAFFSERLGDNVEILVVANGSNDQTAAVAEEVACTYPCIQVINEPRRIGKGGAVILGVKKAIGDWIGFVDADGATSAEEFERLYQCATKADGVIGSRWMHGAQVNIPQRGLRLLSSRLFNLLIRTLLGLKYKDTQCGAKIFTAQAWKSILPQIGVTRYAFDVDVLFQLKRNGFHINEEPTVWNDVEGSKVRIMNTSFEMFCAVIRMRLVHSSCSFLVRWYERFLSKPMEFLLSDELFRHAALLFIASIVTAFGNVGFQMIVSRALPATEYTLLATFLALFAILARPLDTLSIGVNHYTSRLVEEKRMGVVPRLLAKWTLLAGGTSVVLSVVCILFAQRIATFFHLERVAPVIVSAVTLPAIFMAPVLGGVLQGLQRFVWTSVAGILNALGRVLFGGVLVIVLFPACGWALAGHVGGMYLALLVSLGALVPILKFRRAHDGAVPSMRLYLLQCFFIQISIAVLMNGDVVMVKHYLPDNTDFAYAATLGRMVALMSATVAMAMFPKVSSAGKGFSKNHRSVYLRSQLYTACIVVAALAVCILFPAPMLRFLFKIIEPSTDVLSYARWMALVMALVTLLNINVFLLMAQRRFRLLGIVLLSALFYLIGVYRYHDSAYQIIVFAGVASLMALVVTTIGILNSKEQEENI